MSGPDVVIAGGGPAGAAAAVRLAGAGAAVTLVERTAGPHDKVCGEFLSAEALALLSGLGVRPADLGAVPIDRMRLTAGSRSSETALPFAAASLSRRILDETLLDRAASAGATVLRGTSVRGFAADATGVTVRLDGGRRLRTSTLLVATGKHDLHGHRRPDGIHGDLVGFKLHLRGRGAAPGRTELVGIAGGYAGVQPVGDGLTTLCLLVGRHRLRRAGGGAGLLAALARECPRLAGLLDTTRPVQARPLAVSGIPYGFVRRRAEAGVRWLGDQAAVIPSFSGDGMSIALWTGMEAAESILSGEDADAFQARVAAAVRSQVGRATALSRLMVRPWFQVAAVRVVAAAPSLARVAARATRLEPVFGAL